MSIKWMQLQGEESGWEAQHNIILFYYIGQMQPIRPQPRDKKSSSSKKMHRRVITEVEEPVPPIHRHELKKSERERQKPKFIDVYSKYLPRDTQRKTYKINPQRGDTRQLKTEADERPSVGQRRKAGARYEVEGVAGKGTFGVVYMGVDRNNGERIAIKKVFQDKKYKNREHTILKMLEHPNCLSMRDSFLTHEGDDEYLNIVMDFYPDNLYQVIKKREVTPPLIKLYAYQLFRGLNFLAMISVAHRDIKPQNVLVDNPRRKLVITDFGSAKQLSKTEANLAYICSRCYRAPELIFGATDYTPQIDMWSAGCVLVEMINGSPPFMGDSQIDQLIEIIKVLGTPSREEVEEMNRKYDMREYAKFPRIKATPWKHMLQSKDPLLTDLVHKVLQYSPSRRFTPADAILHEYFDELRDETRYHELLFKLKTIPQLFDFSQEQLKFVEKTSQNKTCPQPKWCGRKPMNLQLTGNKPTMASTNTKRSVMSYKAI